VTFFLETDNANLGKVVGGTKTISTGFGMQDAYLEWKVGTRSCWTRASCSSRSAANCYESAASLLPLDYGAYSFLQSAATQSVVSPTRVPGPRHPCHNRLEYRLCAFQGARDRLSGTPSARRPCPVRLLRRRVRVLHYGTYLGKKKVLTVGAV